MKDENRAERRSSASLRDHKHLGLDVAGRAGGLLAAS